MEAVKDRIPMQQPPLPRPPCFARWLATAILFLVWQPFDAQAETQALPSKSRPSLETLRLTWKDSARNREVPVLIYLPKDRAAPAPVIIFSHGLGGSREGYAYLGQHWASHGYASVHLQHHGSDDAVWKEASPADRMQALRRAAALPGNAIDRPRDVSFAIDELTRLNALVESPLHSRLDLAHVGVAGHSFGGFTAMAIAGQSFRSSGAPPFADPRVGAVIQMSAPVIQGSRTPSGSLEGITIPVFHMTGTEDDSPVGETSARDRRVLFDLMKQPETCLVTFKDGDHMIFSGRWQRDAALLRQDTVFQALICESSTAFWDAHLRGRIPAHDWLYHGGFAAALGARGVFETKEAPAR